MQIKVFYFNELRVCTYLLWDDTLECVIVDCGCENEHECARLQKFIANHNLKPVMLLSTHGHFDHNMSNAFITKTYNIKSYIHVGDKAYLAQTAEIAKGFGYNNVENPPAPDGYLEDGQIIRFGQSQLQVLHTPGHSKGSVCFYAEESNFVLTGDLLFQGCIGRTDLPGGDYDEIIDSLLNKIVPLPDKTVVYSGHGPATTVGEEKRANPFIVEKM
ncbi:MAG: MBL fold metallo-hydrolase [Bacteroidales bacterium]|nr:MBL fold metallo-hydrolase [Bacteroidales bacterium]